MNNLSGASYRMSGLVELNSRSDNHYCLSMSSKLKPFSVSFYVQQVQRSLKSPREITQQIALF